MGDDSKSPGCAGKAGLPGNFLVIMERGKTDEVKCNERNIFGIKADDQFFVALDAIPKTSLCF